jgi:hypothetical protein
VSPRQITRAAREAAVRDYLAGDSASLVAARYSIARSTLARWVESRHDVALTGGRWVDNGRGVQVWKPFDVTATRGTTPRQHRIETEDAMFDIDEARAAHARYVGGCREPRTVVGERVYQRRIKRARRITREAGAA